MIVCFVLLGVIIYHMVDLIVDHLSMCRRFSRVITSFTKRYLFCDCFFKQPLQVCHVIPHLSAAVVSLQ